MKEIIKVLQKRKNEFEEIFHDSNKRKESFIREIEESKSRIQRNESKLKTIRNDIKHYNKKRNDLESELQDIQDAGRIDTTGLEKEEEELKDAILKSSILEEDQKIKYDQYQKEYKILKNELTNAEKKKDNYDRQIKEQEKILHEYIANCQSRVVLVERAKKSVTMREKALNEVVKILENHVVIRQKKIDEASEKVRIIAIFCFLFFVFCFLFSVFCFLFFVFCFLFFVFCFLFFVFCFLFFVFCFLFFVFCF